MTQIFTVIGFLLTLMNIIITEATCDRYISLFGMPQTSLH